MRNCNDHKMEFVKRVKSNGQPLLNKQCLNCGYHGSTAYKLTMADFTKIPFFSEELKNKYFITKMKYKEQLLKEQRDYYNSEQWQKLRKEVIKEANNECFFCKNVGTDVHHTSYDNWKNESIDELILLCRDCHIKVHEDMPKLGFFKERYDNYEND